MIKKQRAIVALSGGADSAFAAWKLCSLGYDVIGVHFKLWKWESNNEREVSEEKENDRITKLGEKLNIPVEIIDAREKFYELIIQDLKEKLDKGYTPNPCIQCNPLIKFSLLMDYATKNDAEEIATGHYAIIQKKMDQTYAIFKARDKHKDQSYFLCYLNQKILKKTIFPLGDTLKKENQLILRDLKLFSTDGKESQDLCFLKNHKYREFIQSMNLKTINPGEMLDTQGKLLGTHKGLAFYTIGQRKGIGLSSHLPYYVIGKNVEENQLKVGRQDELDFTEMVVKNINWISEKEMDATNCQVKIRYRSSDFPCEIHKIEKHSYVVKFNQSIRDITPGQYAVFYQGDEMLGGGVIERARKG